MMSCIIRKSRYERLMQDIIQSGVKTKVMLLAPVVRGQGLGVVLLQACLDHVTAVFPQLESAVLLVNATWTPARRIYTGLGFMEIGCLAGFFEAEDGARQDGNVMRRPIRMPAPQSPQPITHYENFPVASWLCPAQLRAPTPPPPANLSARSGGHQRRRKQRCDRP